MLHDKLLFLPFPNRYSIQNTHRRLAQALADNWASQNGLVDARLLVDDVDLRQRHLY